MPSPPGPRSSALATTKERSSRSLTVVTPSARRGSHCPACDALKMKEVDEALVHERAIAYEQQRQMLAQVEDARREAASVRSDADIAFWEAESAKRQMQAATAEADAAKMQLEHMRREIAEARQRVEEAEGRAEGERAAAAQMTAEASRSERELNESVRREAGAKQQFEVERVRAEAEAHRNGAELSHVRREWQETLRRKEAAEEEQARLGRLLSEAGHAAALAARRAEGDGAAWAEARRSFESETEGLRAEAAALRQRLEKAEQQEQSWRADAEAEATKRELALREVADAKRDANAAREVLLWSSPEPLLC